MVALMTVRPGKVDALVFTLKMDWWKMAAMERAKKATGAAKGKKQNRGSSSHAGLTLGWSQGDWIRSSLQQEDLWRVMSQPPLETRPPSE